MEYAGGVLWKRRREGGLIGQLMCMWGMEYSWGGVKGSTGKLIIGDKKGVWVTRTVRRKPEEEIWGRENVENIVGGGLEE